MTHKTGFRIFPINFRSLALRMAIGGLIGLLFIAVFLYPSEPDPAWGPFWWVRPFIAVPVAGAMGGAFNYLISQQTFKRRWIKVVAIIFSVFVFFVALWMGSVVGLDGTYWD